MDVPDNSKLLFTEVVTYYVELPCKEKNCSGKMEAKSGNYLLSFPPQFPHVCTVCGKVKYIKDKQFPMYTQIPHRILNNKEKVR